MVKYTIKRILYFLLVFFIIMLMCFVLIRMLPLPQLPPGDPHTKVLEMRRQAMGYDKPCLIQFALFLRGIVTSFDWGFRTSCISDRMCGLFLPRSSRLR